MTRGRASLQVYLIDLDALAPELEALQAKYSVLSADEVARHARFERPEAARRWAATRLALRVIFILENIASARAAILQAPAGRPYVAGAPPFSLSHTGGEAAIAVAGTGSIGIDIEHERPARLPEPRHSLFIAAGAAMRPNEIGTPSFLTSWTRLEACAKATGDGVGAVLARLAIWGHGGATATPTDVARRTQDYLAAHGLAVADLPLGPARYGAVAASAAIMAELRMEPLTPAHVASARASLAADCG